MLPKLPEQLEPLREIAYNVWFSWNWEAVQLFIRLDAEYWEKTYQNPALMLGAIPQERFDELARDEGFLATMKRVHAQFRAYMEAPTWFSRSYPDAMKSIIAYFSTEFGIDVGLPIYSGGLGVLAGDHLKSASDLGLPLVAVGLLYRRGISQAIPDRRRLAAGGVSEERLVQHAGDAGHGRGREAAARADRVGQRAGAFPDLARAGRPRAAVPAGHRRAGEPAGAARDHDAPLRGRARHAPPAGNPPRHRRHAGADGDGDRAEPSAT